LGIIIAGLPAAVFGAFLLAFRQRIYPKTWIAGSNIGGLTVKQAEKIINEKIEQQKPLKINLNHQKQNWEIDFQALNLKYNYQKTAQKAFALSRRKPIKNWFRPKYIDLDFSLNQDLLDKKLSTIAAQLSQPAIPPQISLSPKTKEITVSQGKQGQKLDQEKLKKIIKRRLATLNFDSLFNLPIVNLNHLPTDRQIKEAKKRAEKLVGKNITLITSQQNFIIDENQLINFIGFSSWWNDQKISEYVQVLGQSVDKTPKDALFMFEDGRAVSFQPDQPGFKLDKKQAKKLIKQALNELVNDKQIAIKELVLKKLEPKIKTSDTNRLGIIDLLGEGESFFHHSISSRIHNVDLASSRLHGLLIAPGEVFSLNQALGEISKTTGYRDAYIIKNGRTVLGSGGGVCQISTTLFRAALNSGLPIIERHAHAYRVSYYEEGSRPGFDATVFSPNADLKFKNDTPAYILIQRKFNQKKRYLAFQLFGSPDKRKVEISNIKLWDIIPPPEDRYIDDPTLPLGTIKQIDFKSWGAKAAFDWKVTRNGETLYQQTFFSHYRPWQAVFLRGSKI